MKWWHVYATAALATAVLSGVLTAICRRLAPRLGLLDVPLHEAHKRHGRATPVMGGAAMAAAWLLAVAGGLLFFGSVRPVLHPSIAVHAAGVFSRLPELGVIALGAVALTAMGMVDDRRSLRAGAKFTVQLLVAALTASAGVRITAFVAFPGASWVLTVLWIAGIVNAMNFLDNMDGLAAGVAAIAAYFFLFTAAMRGQHFVAVLAAVTCGSACGFLWHNRPPAAIFMGDAGSHLLGYLLAVLGALTTFYDPAETPTPAAILMPLLILGLPIFDAIAVVILRLREGRPVYVGDHTHISHRFAWLGLSRPKAVLLACLLAFAIGCGAMLLLWLPPAGAVVVVLQCGTILAIVSVMQ
ncbi:MAG: undecaprenyl/decaprenyl-phosphate alpha-N-acetylglucosaminyl 1-phosphate transferase, partial [Lentisphaeria bacterium]|nr:undecaprenyl/decaprenyl-phosphate alpha-N-acetylglucosaminyl 1-phosphate transferase [Lentisphaeria bacterium]